MIHALPFGRCGLLVTGLLAASGLVAAAPVDLSPWSAESYPAVAGFGAGVWTVSGGGSSVLQSVNGQPTLFIGDFDAYGSKIAGTIRVPTAGGTDDDFIGFALGIKPGDTTNTTADYLLIDWKRGTQFFDFGAPSASGGGFATAGLAVSRVTGIPDADEFWQHANLLGTPAGSGLQQLARGATLGATGWALETDYEFEFDFGPHNLVVSVNGVQQFDLSGGFANGRMGFYNFSQAQVRHSAFELEPGSFPPDVDPPPGRARAGHGSLPGGGARRARLDTTPAWAAWLTSRRARPQLGGAP